MSAMVFVIAAAVLIVACPFCSSAPVHEASPIQQQHCDFYNWCSAGSYCDAGRCLPCPAGKYQPPPQHNAHRCVQHSVCRVTPMDHDINDGRTGVILRKGNRTHDTACECETGKYWNETERGCREISKCPAGEGVSNIAVAMSNTKCTPCTLGSFSDKVSAEQVCRVCADCRTQGREIQKACTPVQDTVCGAIAIPHTEPLDIGPTDDTSPPNPSLPHDEEPDKELPPGNTTGAVGELSPVQLLQPSQIAMTVGAVLGLPSVVLIVAAVSALCVYKKRRRKTSNHRQARPDPEGQPQQHQPFLPTSPVPVQGYADQEDEEEDEEKEDATLPKEAVTAARRPVQDTHDPKGNEEDLSLKETRDGLEEIPEGAEGETSVKDARAPTRDTCDPEGNERDLHTKDANDGLEELTSDGDITVMTSRAGDSEDEDLYNSYKETSV